MCRVLVIQVLYVGIQPTAKYHACIHTRNWYRCIVCWHTSNWHSTCNSNDCVLYYFYQLIGGYICASNCACMCTHACMYTCTQSRMHAPLQNQHSHTHMGPGNSLITQQCFFLNILDQTWITRLQKKKMVPRSEHLFTIVNEMKTKITE